MFAYLVAPRTVFRNAAQGFGNYVVHATGETGRGRSSGGPRTLTLSGESRRSA